MYAAELEDTLFRFPEARPSLSALEVADVIMQLNNMYEAAVLATVPGYEDAEPASSRPRKNSRVIREDQLRIVEIRYGSPLEILAAVGDIGTQVSAGTLLVSGAIIAVRKALDSAADIVDTPSNRRYKRERNAIELRNLEARTRLLELDVASKEERQRKAKIKSTRLAPAEDQPLEPGTREGHVSHAIYEGLTKATRLELNAETLTRSAGEIVRIVGSVESDRRPRKKKQ